MPSDLSARAEFLEHYRDAIVSLETESAHRCEPVAIWSWNGGQIVHAATGKFPLQELASFPLDGTGDYTPSPRRFSICLAVVDALPSLDQRVEETATKVRSFGRDTYARMSFPDFQIFTPGGGATPRHAIVKRDCRVSILVPTASAVYGRLPIRVGREILLRASENQGGTLLHSAAVVEDRGAWLMLGDSGAGKSTVMWHFCAGGGFGFLSNDRCIVSEVDDGYVAAAFPLTVRLGRGLLAAHPYGLDLADFPFERSEQPDFDPDLADPALIASLRGERLKFEFTPVEMARIFGRKNVEQSRVLGLIVPDLDNSANQLVLQRMSTADAEAKVKAAALSPEDHAFGSGWLDVRTRSTAWISERAARAASVLASRPAFRLVGGIRASRDCWRRVANQVKTLRL